LVNRKCIFQLHTSEIQSELLNVGVLTQSRDEERKKAVCDALELVVAAAAVSGESKQVKKEVDAERAGIVVFRIP